MPDSYASAVKKIIELIKKNGIPVYVKQWEIPVIPSKFKSFDDFFKFIAKLCSLYNKHTFPMIHNINLLDKHDRVDRPLPEFKYDAKNKIGTFIFYHFYGYAGELVKKDANNIIKQVRTTYAEFIQLGMVGLIIDLRKHLGGNMWPHILALADIYGNTTLLSFGRVAAKRSDTLWTNIVNNKILYRRKFMTDRLAFSRPVAIIVSNRTTSSGEFIAATFIGRPNARIFGDKTDKTAGYLSVNNIYKINSDIDIALTVAFPTTIDGIFRTGYIVVDQISEQPMADAKKWIINTTES